MLDNNIFKCSNCGFSLTEDLALSLLKYDDDYTILLNSEGKLDELNAPEGTVYICNKCGANKYITFDEVIKYKQSFIVKSVIHRRVIESLTHTKRQDLDPDLGMSYCGICSGPFEGEGYCHNSWKDLCVVRQNKLRKE